MKALGSSSCCILKAVGACLVTAHPALATSPLLFQPRQEALAAPF